jgi:hypothetical protein
MWTVDTDPAAPAYVRGGPLDALDGLLAATRRRNEDIDPSTRRSLSSRARSQGWRAGSGPDHRDQPVARSSLIELPPSTTMH